MVARRGMVRGVVSGVLGSALLWVPAFAFAVGPQQGRAGAELLARSHARQVVGQVLSNGGGADSGAMSGGGSAAGSMPDFPKSAIGPLDSPTFPGPALTSGAPHGRRDGAPESGEIQIRGLNSLGGSSASWGIVVLLTLLTLIPSMLMCVTPFARLLIVFHFLRQALGLQTTPSNQTLIGLSLILTFFLMEPVGAVIYRDSVVPVQQGKITPLDGVVRAGEPMRHFMAHYVREKDAELFLEIAKEPKPRTIEDLSFRVLLPAYILSELKAGFQIGTVLFLPFLIVDMVVASITTSVGMMQLPPVVISTPLKLLLFLMVDGWHLLIGALMRSFQ
jgi:flagellar biosynthetic protein FliP